MRKEQARSPMYLYIIESEQVARRNQQLQHNQIALVLSRKTPLHASQYARVSP